MKPTSLLRTVAHLLAVPALAPAAFAQDVDLAPIYVTSDDEISPSQTVVVPDQLAVAPSADGGDFLSKLPGVSASRMGGHGGDITIRGQQQNQISVIDAGSVTYGACPNRMDPPTSVATINRAAEVIVTRGYASVTNGPGATGGTVELVRSAPQFDVGQWVTAQLKAGGITGSDAVETSGLVSFNLGQGFYAQGFASYATANDYKDGSGTRVRSGYDHDNEGVTLGYARDGVDLAVEIERDKAKDVRFAGAGMDSPRSETMTYRFRGEADLTMGALRGIEGNVYMTTVNHVMDNYSDRPVGMMAMRVPSSSDTWGGRMAGRLEFGATRATIGADVQSNTRKATAYGGTQVMLPMVSTAAEATQRFYLWPDVTIRQIGFFAETETDLQPGTLLRLGLRYDRVHADADRAGETPGGAMLSPDDLYRAHYGTGFDRARTEHNIGGLIRLEQDLGQNMRVFAGVSRSVRTADATERAMARPDWVGNPDINPEKHTQFNLGLDTGGDTWGVSAVAYVDAVDDFILRDARSVPGVTTYRNINARLAGVEVAGRWRSGGVEIAGDATYTYGENRSDHRALAQIPPLFGKLSAAYGQDAWRAGVRANWSLKQTRTDPSRDPGKTPGWVTLDLFGTYDVTERVRLSAGVDNLLDKSYANHLSRANLFDPTLTQVNEPGRRAYVGLEATF